VHESFVIMARHIYGPDNSKKRWRARRRKAKKNQLTGGGGADTVTA
jgi:hypothetical protein